ncbi:MAG TPA: serine hydrolase domain-containing protein [Polyangiaceae bacterium]|nr:serine hydrolase domain-containing protein [Polyangiaceae bacterium]
MPNRFRRLAALTLAGFAAACSPNKSPAPSDVSPTPTELTVTLERRLSGDRTGACAAAAVIDVEVERAFVCANAQSARSLDGRVAFEIGSITKTMTGFLLADLIERGMLQLDDPLAMHLPQGTPLPSYRDAPIRLRHLVTHTAGLPSIPSRMPILDPENPYAALSEAQLLASLADVELTVAPGQRWAYSNFGFMLLSYVIARTSGESLEKLLSARLFEPLGMAQSFIASPPENVAVARGHLATGSATRAWDFPVDLAGVGGVRASLEDMVRYAQAALGEGDPQAVALLERALLPLPSEHGEPAMGLGWFLLPLEGRTIAMHDGGTGGFSSLMALDRQRQRAVVLLLDTSFGNLGGVEELALHLFDPDAADLPAPRLEAQPEAALLAALSGRYRLGELLMTLRTRGGVLFVQAESQAELELGYDSYGDFFARTFDALLTPLRRADGAYTFRWTQGEVLEAERLP